MRTAVFLASFVVIGGAAFGQLMAAAPDPAAVQKVVDARVGHYKEIGKAAKGIKDELGGAQPNLTTVRTNANVIQALAKQIPGWFPNGSGAQPGVKTEALPTIWQQTPLFRQRAAGLAGAAHQISVAAASGSLDATRAAAGHLGDACKACHDTFREKK
jgi:cytochrome c556